MNGFPPQRETFFQRDYAQENLSSWERLWGDCIQEETKMDFESNKQGGYNDHSLVGKKNKRKGEGHRNGNIKSEDSISHPM